MSTEALKMISEGLKGLEANRREEVWREIYGPPVLPEDLVNRPLGSLNEPLRKGTIASVVSEMEKEGVAISPVDLARLVDTRLRRSASNKTPDYETIAAEIEATLDLVEHCQWRIGLRKKEWGARCRKWAEPYFARLMPPEEKAARAKIEEQTYPLDYHRGLILIGVGGDGPKKREARYWPFLRQQFASFALWESFMGREMSKQDICEEVETYAREHESEIKEQLKCRKEQGWADADHVLRERDSWQKWNLHQTKQKRSAAGRKSGEARKPKAKLAKTSKRRK